MALPLRSSWATYGRLRLDASDALELIELLVVMDRDRPNCRQV